MFDRTSLRETSVAVVLAAITGYVDAIGFTRLFGVFPANQSGNVVLFGIALGDPDWGRAWRPALSMTAFLLGVTLGLVLAGRFGDRVRARMTTLVALEAGLLAVTAALAGDIQDRTVPFGGGVEVLMLAVAATAMGVQTDVIRRAAQVTVWTTFTTGAMVQLTDEVTGDLVHERRPDERGRRLLIVLGAVLAVYVLGAAAGAAVADAWGGALWLAVAGATLLAVGVAVSRR